MHFRIALFATPPIAREIETELGDGFELDVSTPAGDGPQCGPLEAGTDAVVIAWDGGDAPTFARAVRIRDRDVPILILCGDSIHAEAAAIRLDPYLPGPVHAVPRAGLADRVRAEIALRRQGASHRATLSALQGELARRVPEARPAAAGVLPGLFDLLPVGLIFVAPDARVMSANRWACDRLTTTSVIAAGSSLESVFPATAAGALRQAVLSGAAHRAPGGASIEFERTLPGDELATFTVTVLPDRPNRGNGAVLLVQDVTLLRVAEQARRTAERSQATASLAAGVSHHMNNLLASILGNLELLEDALSPGPAIARAAAIHRSIGRAERLNRALLIHAGLERYHPHEIDLEEILGDLAREMFPGPEDVARFSYRVEPDARRIATDPEQLDRALRILLQNAREATAGTGRIEVLARLVAADAASVDTDVRGRIRCEIRDQGAGMTPETLTQAFDPFFTTRGMAEHTGLGLATARGFARRAGGELLLESTPGQGTVASLILPITPDQDIVTPRAEDNAHR